MRVRLTAKPQRRSGATQPYRDPPPSIGQPTLSRQGSRPRRHGPADSVPDTRAVSWVWPPWSPCSIPGSSSITRRGSTALGTTKPLWRSKNACIGRGRRCDPAGSGRLIVATEHHVDNEIRNASASIQDHWRQTNSQGIIPCTTPRVLGCRQGSTDADWSREGAKW